MLSILLSERQRQRHQTFVVAFQRACAANNVTRCILFGAETGQRDTAMGEPGADGQRVVVLVGVQDQRHGPVFREHLGCKTRGWQWASRRLEQNAPNFKKTSYDNAKEVFRF